MKGIKHYWQLLAMWLLIIMVLSGLAFASQWLASKYVTDSSIYQLSWFVVASATLVPGDRLTQDHVALRLGYLKDEKPTTVHTISSVLTRFVQKAFMKGQTLVHDDLAPAPLLEVPPNSLIVPVSVKLEHAEGLKPGMRVRFERATAPGTGNVQIQSSKGLMGNEGGFKRIIKEKNRQHLDSTPANTPLVVILKTVVQSQDKKSAVLHVCINGVDAERVHELTSTDLIPFILPSDS
jgi:hypothetical protein